MRDQAILSRRALAMALPFAAFAAAPAATLAAPSSAGADAALLNLGERWHAALAALYQDDLACADLRNESPAVREVLEANGDRLFAEEQALFDKIMSTPARTLQGLAVKGQALARAFDVMEPGTAPVEAALAPEIGDLGVHSALTLALDILRLAGSLS